MGMALALASICFTTTHKPESEVIKGSRSVTSTTIASRVASTIEHKVLTVGGDFHAQVGHGIGVDDVAVVGRNFYGRSTAVAGGVAGCSMGCLSPCGSGCASGCSMGSSTGGDGGGRKTFGGERTGKKGEDFGFKDALFLKHTNPRR